MLLRRRTLAAAGVVVVSLGAGTTAAQARSVAPPTRQQAYVAAADRYKVPAPVLLGVSYLESRWDTNNGLPSVSGGYGPMHLMNAATRADPAANIRAGAALLAKYQRDLRRPPTSNAGGWYAAVARYGGSGWFADQVYSVIRSGAARTTDDGQHVTLAAVPNITPDRSDAARTTNDGQHVTVAAVPQVMPGRSGVRARAAAGTDCPRALGCQWVPAPYQQLDPEDASKFGNYDKADRPAGQKIDYIVIHDTETSYAEALKLVQDPTYLGWHYTIRSQDGHVAQHVRVKDVGRHAGNWYINSKSIGIEHEGYVADGAWYTEAMYRASARLVRYLAGKYGVPLDRGHIIGHDNVPARIMGTVNQMHQDPGPYWDWAHYFTLLGSPLRGTAKIGREVMIRPDYAQNKVPYTGCDAKDPDKLCPAHGGGSIMLRTAPYANAPLVKDIGAHPRDGTATMSVYDHSARAATGQTYAVAGHSGSWVAIWYLGQKAWFDNPRSRPTAVGVGGRVATPKRGAASVPIYGMAYPEEKAFPKGVAPPADKSVAPMGYVFAAGQKYAVTGSEHGEYFHSVTYDPSKHIVVKGAQKYYEIQFGHRFYYVKAADVTLS